MSSVKNVTLSTNNVENNFDENNSLRESREEITSNDELFLALSTFFTCMMAFMCIAGVIMNSLSIFIFTRPALRGRSINVLLCGLSASDFALCALALPVFSLSQLQAVFPSVSPTTVTKMLIYLYPMTWMAQTMGVWMLVGITVDRWLAICKPFSVRVYCRVSRALLTICGIFVFSVGYNFVRFWEYSIDNDGEIIFALRSDYRYMLFYQNIATMLTQFALPLGFISYLNLQVAKTILHAQQTRREIVSASEKREHSTSKMMLWIVVVFIFCYSLSFCLNVLEMFFPGLFRTAFGFMLNDLNNVLVVLNSSSSFVFYTHFSSRYRQQMRGIFQGIQKRRRETISRGSVRQMAEITHIFSFSEQAGASLTLGASFDIP